MRKLQGKAEKFNKDLKFPNSKRDRRMERERRRMVASFLQCPQHPASDRMGLNPEQELNQFHPDLPHEWQD